MDFTRQLFGQVHLHFDKNKKKRKLEVFIT